MDIIAEILGAAQGKIRKTELMSTCNMSSAQMKEYLDLILGTRLLAVENDGTCIFFKISDKGKIFLRAYETLKSLME